MPKETSTTAHPDVVDEDHDVPFCGQVHAHGPDCYLPEDLDYDDVIAEAKRLGFDPYDGTGEYRPAAISAAIASLSR